MKQSTGHLKRPVLLLPLIFLAVLLSADGSAFAQATPDKETAKKSGERIEAPPAAESQRGPAPGSASSISEKNIFSPERRDFPLPTAEAKKPLVRPQIVLYGVTIAGNYEAASIANPGRPLRKGERETMTLKTGDKVGEYTLAKILSDRISLEAPGDTFEVLLYDARMPKKRMEVKTETKPAAVTSSLPSEAPKTAPTPVAEKPRAPLQEKVSTPAPAPTPQVPTQIPRPILRSRRGRMMYSPSPGTPTTPATPAPIQGERKIEEGDNGI
jgi:hypothetical protein